MPSIHEAINLDTESLVEPGPAGLVAENVKPTAPTAVVAGLAAPNGVAQATPASPVDQQVLPASGIQATASIDQAPPTVADGGTLPASQAEPPPAPTAPDAIAPANSSVLTQSTSQPSAPTMPTANQEPVATTNTALIPTANTATTPIAPQPVNPMLERDPLLGAHPDIIPNIELPPERLIQNPPAEQTAAATPPENSPLGSAPNPEPSVGQSPIPTAITDTPIDPTAAGNVTAPSQALSANPPANPSAPVERDPLLGDHPDIMPKFDLPTAPSSTQGAPEASQPQPAVMQTPAPAPQPIEQPTTSPTAANPSPDSATPATATSLAPSQPLAPTAESIQPPSTPTQAPIAAATPAEPPAAPSLPTPPPTAPANLPAVSDQPKVTPPASTPAVQTSPAPVESPRRVLSPEELLEQPVELPPLSSPDDAPPTSSLNPPGGISPVIQEPGTVLASSMFVEPRGKDAATENAKSDKAVGDDPAALKSKLPRRSVFEAGKAMARVGEEVITLRELKYAVKQRRNAIPPGQQLTSEENYMLAKGVLNDMIDRSLVVQEAKRAIKNKKQFQMFMDMADKIWKDEELPVLLRKYSVSNIYELREKLIEQDDSIEQLREAYRQDFLFRGFIDQKLGPKMKVELPEMIDYYNEHLKEFDQAAQITWREIVVDTNPRQSRAEAKKKADLALTRLRRGDDFATVASELSEGPNKGKGGLWKTAPGSYNVASVNVALESLPIGRTSQVIEAPTGFHIVRVEARRPAGPQTFAEVQDDIRRILRTQKVRQESSAYLESLRKQTPITTVFDEKNGVEKASVEVETPPVKSASK